MSSAVNMRSSRPDARLWNRQNAAAIYLLTAPIPGFFCPRLAYDAMPNRLAHETSPYLQQHAANPVDWYPWGEEALRAAREQNKPILLSVGYSACHWCHVMAHESFEDADVAAVMNRNFINIKVDREERPDLDQIYQTAHHMMSQRAGGWPLTMFLTPEQKPFYGGTYFPKTARYNLPGFPDLLERVAQAYREQTAAIAEQSDELTALFDRTLPAAQAAVVLDEQPARTRRWKSSNACSIRCTAASAARRSFRIRRSWSCV